MSVISIDNNIITLEILQTRVYEKYWLLTVINQEKQRLEVIASCKRDCSGFCAPNCICRLHDLEFNGELDNVRENNIPFSLDLGSNLPDEMNFGPNPNKEFMYSELGQKLKAFNVLHKRGMYCVLRTDECCSNAGCTVDGHINKCPRILQDLGFGPIDQVYDTWYAPLLIRPARAS